MEQERRRTGGRAKHRCFRVYLDIPTGATEDEVMDYIEDAVSCWRGSYRPDNPIFGLNGDSVTVKRHTKKYAEIT